jgi:flavin-dependent dehydrogenase
MSNTKNAKKNVVVIGSGPIGIETSLALVKSGYKVTLLEKSAHIAGHVRKWGHVKLFSPNKLNCSEAGLQCVKERLKLTPTSGYLQKKSVSSFLKPNHNRWFVLKEDGNLAYYEDEKCEDEKRKLSLAKAVVDPKENSLEFEITFTDGMKLQLKAKDESERDMWVDKIAEAIAHVNKVGGSVPKVPTIIYIYGCGSSIAFSAHQH